MLQYLKFWKNLAKFTVLFLYGHHCTNIECVAIFLKFEKISQFTVSIPLLYQQRICCNLLNFYKTLLNLL